MAVGSWLAGWCIIPRLCGRIRNYYMVLRHTLTVLSVGCVGPMCIVRMVARASGSHSREGRQVGLVGDVLGHGVW